MFIEPTDEGGRHLVERDISGPVMMLNLLRFREVADYSAHPELAPPEPISGSEAYDRYAKLNPIRDRYASTSTSPILPAHGRLVPATNH